MAGTGTNQNSLNGSDNGANLPQDLYSSQGTVSAQPETKPAAYPRIGG